MEKSCLCPVCTAETDASAFGCKTCGASLIIARLISRGAGLIPNGHVLPLAGRDYLLGPEMHSDFVIPSNAFPKPNLQLTYGEKGFTVRVGAGGGGIFVNDRQLTAPLPLKPGDIVRIGPEAFTYRDEPRVGGGVAGGAEAMIILQAVQAFERAGDIKDVCLASLRAVMDLTKLDRGMFFFVREDEEEEVDLLRCAALKRQDGEIVVSQDAVSVSQSMLTKTLLSGGTVAIEDALQSADVSASMVDMKLRALVCVPIPLPDAEAYRPQDCLGLIYADSHLPVSRIPAHTEALLTVLSDILGRVLLRWRV